jgi:hypothetical protein
MIKALFDQIATPTQLRELNIVEVLDWTTDVLNRVDRKAFFENFEEGHAVQYFYEPFLQAFDPELRKELGVWFTPIEIVKYMVARVDTVLREELDIPDGLADPRVYVLDPCCGTGAYLVEVLHKIHETLKAKGEDALAANDLKRAAIDRVFGFEILPAPFVVSHLQLGLLLQNLGAPLIESTNERVGVYLTNALTGWEPPSEEVKARLNQLAFSFAELRAEYDAAERVKQEVPILVILGNPPYNAFAGTSPEEEQGLVEPYKEGLITEWGIKKFNLDDLYVRFFRLAERRIAQSEGVICYVSNYSYLSDPSFVVARQRFLAEFDKLWFDSMNGDSRETGKLTPDGKPDPSVFSTEYNREGIRVGTAVGLMVRKKKRDAHATARYRQFWGVTKRADILTSLNTDNLNASYEIVAPDKSSRLSFRPANVATHYQSWPRLVDICGQPPSNGLMEKRGGALIDIDKSSLEQRMRSFYDLATSWETLETLATGLTVDAARFNAKKTRAKVTDSETYQPVQLLRYALRPLDTRWCYYSPIRPLWNETRPTLWAQCWEGNSFVMSRPSAAASPEGMPLCYTTLLGDNDYLRGHAYYFPLRLRATINKKSTSQSAFFEDAEESDNTPKANLSRAARAYLAQLGFQNADVDVEAGSLVWNHTLAIGYAHAYLAENADGIRQNWPRIPLPSTKDALLHSAELGRKIAALLDTEKSVAGVTAGAIGDPFRHIGAVSHVDEKSLDPVEDLKLTVGWGHAGKGNATMPGRGKLIERYYTGEELVSLTEAAVRLGLDSIQMSRLIGGKTYDVYLNDSAYWKNVPARVWEYTIGGYQVMKKWLSYRELELLGRPLTPDETREVMNMARRIAAIVLLEPALDANYQAVKDSTYSWPSALSLPQ